MTNQTNNHVMNTSNTVTTTPPSKSSNPTADTTPNRNNNDAIVHQHGTSIRSRKHNKQHENNTSNTNDNDENDYPKRTKSEPELQPICKEKRRDKESQSQFKLVRDKSMQSIRNNMLKVAFPMKFVDTAPRTAVGSWYLTPERHFLESLMIAFIACFIIYTTHAHFTNELEKNASTREDYIHMISYSFAFKNTNTNNTNINNNYNELLAIFAADNDSYLELLHRILKYVLTIDFLLHVYYKLTKMDPTDDLNKLLNKKYSNIPLYNKNILWLLQPCAFSQFLLVILHWFPMIHTIRTNQFLMSCACGTMAAMLFPDTSHCKRLGECFHFWLQHWIVVILPYFYFILQLIYINSNNNDINKNINDIDEFDHLNLEAKTSLTSFSLTCHVYLLLVWQDFAIWCLYHFVLLEAISIWQGVNLNYIMSPPPAGPARQFGKQYRMVVMTLIFFACSGSGWLVPNLISGVFNGILWVVG